MRAHCGAATTIGSARADSCAGRPPDPTQRTRAGGAPGRGRDGALQGPTRPGAAEPGRFWGARGASNAQARSGTAGLAGWEGDDKRTFAHGRSVRDIHTRTPSRDHAPRREQPSQSASNSFHGAALATQIPPASRHLVRRSWDHPDGNARAAPREARAAGHPAPLGFRRSPPFAFSSPQPPPAFASAGSSPPAGVRDRERRPVAAAFVAHGACGWCDPASFLAEAKSQGP